MWQIRSSILLNLVINFVFGLGHNIQILLRAFFSDYVHAQSIRIRNKKFEKLPGENEMKTHEVLHAARKKAAYEYYTRSFMNMYISSDTFARKY